MRGRRIKLVAEEGEAVYHCMSRTVNGEFLFAAADQEHLRKQIWLVAEYCGLQVLTYAILSNHFHIMVRVPKKEPLPDAELLRRYELLYPRPTKYQSARLSVIKAQLAANDPEAEQWRNRQEKLMGDLSQYLKLVKQRFSIGFNKRHKRYGTLWSERFKSVLLEPGGALRTVAAYIDLNCVRAGLVKDPKDFRFCGYAEAAAGEEKAQDGIAWICGEEWKKSASQYRLHLFCTGADPFEPRGRIKESSFQHEVKRKGELNWAELMRCRLRFLSDSGILGSKAFVAKMTRRCGFDSRREPRSARLAPPTDFLHTLKWSRLAPKPG